MKELTEWWSEIGGSSRKWLMFGKGPTFDKRSKFSLDQFTTIAINHTIRDTKAFVSAIIDMDVVEACAESIAENAEFLLIPRYPHVHCHRGSNPLESWFGSLPMLRELDRLGRLVWYNLSVRRMVHGSPVIPPGKFSAEVVTHMLALLGARELRTLGVDGGEAYAMSFEDVAEATRLANGQPDFNVQFEGISRAIRSTGMVSGPLDMPVPFPVVIGTDVESLDSAVCRYSIQLSSVSADIRMIPQPESLAALNELPGTEKGFLYLDGNSFLTDDLRWILHHKDAIGRSAVADDNKRLIACFSPDGMAPDMAAPYASSKLAPFVGFSGKVQRVIWLNLLHGGITDGTIKRKLVAIASEDGSLSPGEYWKAVRPRVAKRIKEIGRYSALRTLGIIESIILPKPLGRRDV